MAKEELACKEYEVRVRPSREGKVTLSIDMPDPRYSTLSQSFRCRVTEVAKVYQQDNEDIESLAPCAEGVTSRYLAGHDEPTLRSESLFVDGTTTDVKVDEESLNVEEQIFRDRLCEWLKERKGHYVAIRHGKVLGFAKTRKEINAVIEVAVGHAASAFVELIDASRSSRRKIDTIFLR
jgi:hypothetical protein